MIKYVKFSVERKKEYQIETSILSINGKDIIQKRAMNESSIIHINTIEENCRILSEIYGREHVAQCKRIDMETIWIEYITGEILSQKLNNLLKNNNLKGFYRLLDFYIETLLKIYPNLSEKFYLKKLDDANRKYNIDLTFDNVFIKDNKFIIIDYEWLSSNVDKNFVLYRALIGFCARHSNVVSDELKNKWLIKYNLLGKIKKYEEEEHKFINNILCNSYDKYKKQINNLFYKIKQEKIELNKEIENKNKEIENKNKEIENKNKELRAIYNSKGYNFLKKYYKLRDKILPIGSSRRLIVKSIVKCLIKAKQIKRYINKSNIKKSIIILKQGGIRQLLVKFNDKLNSIDLKEQFVYEYDYLNHSLKNNVIEIENKDNLIVDIIIPIYNAYDYTKKCIETVWQNTDINYNLYLVNDCSPDKRIHELLLSLLKKNKPQNLKELNIIENDVNLGFIRSVNKALNLSKNNVVLLNTDTEVPLNWLSRLIYPILKDEKIASVTPFSNCATICSFPNFCKDNELLPNISLNKLDELFSNYGSKQVIDIPTGVGFCMAMSRACLSKFGVLDTIYGKGYGEENDWCRRVAEYGYRNVMITNLFVYHKHGVSFAEQMNKSKQERIEENLIVLTKRYPDYTKLVDVFVANDPIKDIRDFLYYLYLEQINTNKKEGILFINHSCGGGATVYQNNLINNWKNEKRIYSIELLADLTSLCFTIYQDKKNKSFYFNFKDMDKVQFNNLIKAFNINYLYINQLVTYPIEKIINLIKSTRLNYTFFIHDFYAVCPEYTLLNQNRVYCKVEKNIDKCNLCLNKQNNMVCRDIKHWRSMFRDFLLNAAEVIAPSESTAKIVNSYYSDVKIIVKEHSVPEYVHKTFNPEFLKKNILNIAVIGAIGEQKGSKIIYELVEKIREEKLPVNIKIIGITDLQNEYYKSEDGILEITGRYNKEDISDLLAKYQIGVVLIPSIWPETYSYTTSEAIFSGYPVIVFNLGAPAERVRKLKCGWIVDKCNCKDLLNKIMDLLNNKNMNIK